MNCSAARADPPGRGERLPDPIPSARILTFPTFRGHPYMPLILKRLIVEHGISQSELAAAVLQRGGYPLSPASMTQILNYGYYPRSTGIEAIRGQVEQFLRGRGVPEEDIAHAWQTAGGEDAMRHRHPVGHDAKPRGPRGDPLPTEPEPDMFIAPASLAPEARRAFNLFRNPFADDLPAGEEVFRWRDFTYALEAAKDAAVHHRFIAIVGQSGSGKSTLVETLRQEVGKLRVPIMLLEPYVIGMEQSEARGTPMKSTAIADAILSEISPLETPAASHQRRYHQVVKALQASMGAGNRHLLLIEEAHAMPADTLRQLKRWREARGQRLMGILLIGQDELKQRLDPLRAELREVVQRCEIVPLLGIDREVEAYLAHRCKLAGAEPEALFAPDAFDAIREALTFVNGNGGREVITRLHPLSVNNLVVRSLNYAHENGLSRVTAAAIRGALS